MQQSIVRTIKKEDENEIINLFLTKNINLKWDFTYFYKHEDCFGFVLENKGKIIGFGSLIRYMSPKHGIIGRIEDIFIHHDFQDQGYGKLIINELEMLGRKLKLLQIVLTSNPKREAARHIYISKGFQLYETGVFVKEL